MAERIGQRKDRERRWLSLLPRKGWIRWRTPMKTNSRGRKSKVGSEKVSRDAGIPVLHRQERIHCKGKDEQKGKKVIPFFLFFFWCSDT